MSRSDGSITFSTALDNKGLEKELESLTRKIEKTERDLTTMKTQRMPLVKQAKELAAELDNAKAKLYEMKNAANGTFATGVISDQGETVKSLQGRWNEVQKSVDGYDLKISKATQELDLAKTRAGSIAEELAAAGVNSEKMNGAVKQANKNMTRFSIRLKEVARSALVFTIITQALAKFREWMWLVINTNEEARNSMAQLKASLLILAQPLVDVLIPAFTTFLNILVSITTVLARVVSALFGKSYEESKKAAAALNKETSALKGLSSAAKDAAGSLAGFDEINTIVTQNTDVKIDEPIMPDFTEFEKLPEWLENLTLDIEIGITKLKFDWDNNLILESKDDWIVALTAILGGVIGSMFGGVFDGVIGLLIGASIGLIAISFTDKLEEPDKAKELFLVAITGILGAVIGTAFGGFTGGVIGLLIGVSVGLIAITFLDKLSDPTKAQEIFAVVLTGLLGAVIGSMFGGIIGGAIGLLIGVSVGLIAVSFTNKLENPDKAQEILLVVLGAILGAVIGSMFGGFTGGVIGFLLGGLITIVSIEFAKGDSSNWDSKDTIVVVLSAILGAVIGSVFGGFAGGVIGFLLGATISFVAIKFSEGDYNKDSAIASLRVVLMAVLGAIVGTLFGGFVGGVLGLIIGITIGFSSVAFDEKLDANVRSAAEKAFKVALTTIIGALIGAAIGGVFGGIAGGIIGLTLGLAITLSDAKIKNKTINVQGNGMFGGEVSLNRSVPALATGAVVPPNREFMAILGDNKKETEIVSPLSTMKQALMEALQESGGIGGGTVTVVVNLDGKEVARNTVRQINNMTQQAGKSPLLI